MVTLLITALVVFTIIGIALYFLQKSTSETSERVLPPPPDARGLFAPDARTLQEEESKRLALAEEERTEQLLRRAQSGDRSVLSDVHRAGDRALYNRALTELVNQADSDPKLLVLMSHLSQHELPVNDQLALAVLNSWRQSPDRSGTVKALHCAALSDNPDIYRDAVETAVQLRREGKLPDISPVELKALFEGEFWVLSPRARSSGAGFVLKQTLASARRELEAAPRATR
ncbi:MAG TPA: hypothetical protein VJT71_14870 [Pyrinomonadaceae bacterium]|nr:hypothetical protein [Pyrinomonadaceae bacterium]